MYHETCYCPESSDDWDKVMQCPQNYSQIEHDLARFPTIDLKRLEKEAVERFGVHHALCHFSVINNQVLFVLICFNLF